MKNSSIRRLPEWLSAKLANPPNAGSGVHRWLFTMSLQMHGHLSADEIASVLAAAVAHCGRAVDAREIREAVNASAKVTSPAFWKANANFQIISRSFNPKTNNK